MSPIQATQIKITLPEELYFHLKSKADKFGLNLASYVRHLVINDVKDSDIPVFKMSQKQKTLLSRHLMITLMAKQTEWIRLIHILKVYKAAWISELLLISIKI